MPRGAANGPLVIAPELLIPSFRIGLYAQYLVTSERPCRNKADAKGQVEALVRADRIELWRLDQRIAVFDVST
jgi:hypothetical protein